MFIHEVLKGETGQICNTLYPNCRPDKCKCAKYRTRCNIFLGRPVSVTSFGDFNVDFKQI